MFYRLIVLAAVLFCAIPASAGLVTFSLDQTTIDSPLGGIPDGTCANATLACVIFTGTIEFTADQFYFLNAIVISMSPSNPDGGALVVGNSNYFDDNVPGVLGGDGIPADTLSPCGVDSCYTGGLFEIDVPLNAPAGSYSGTVALQYTDQGGDIITSAEIPLGDPQNSGVPEPGMGALMLCGLTSLAAIGRRFHRR